MSWLVVSHAVMRNPQTNVAEHDARGRRLTKLVQPAHQRLPPAAFLEWDWIPWGLPARDYLAI